jgi:hypothetical protein
MNFFGIIEALANITCLAYIVILTIDVIYDAVYARRHDSGRKARAK